MAKRERNIKDIVVQKQPLCHLHFNMFDENESIMLPFHLCFKGDLARFKRKDYDLTLVFCCNYPFYEYFF